jgi:hypothetical protein
MPRDTSNIIAVTPNAIYFISFASMINSKFP